MRLLSKETESEKRFLGDPLALSNPEIPCSLGCPDGSDEQQEGKYPKKPELPGKLSEELNWEKDACNKAGNKEK